MNNWLKINQKLNVANITQGIFKQNCLLCSAPTDSNLSLCQPCIKDLPLAPYPCCQQCGLKTQGEICGNCLKESPYYDYTKALFSYTFPFNAVLQAYKYHHNLFLCSTLAQLFLEGIVHHAFDLIIPMPLHLSRLQERGFNQSLEIARIIAKKINIPIDSTCSQRIKNTPPQASLPLKERQKNMRGAFIVTNKSLVAGKRIAIIDDVMTTGSSLNELAKVLKKAGASTIHCYVLARAL